MSKGQFFALVESFRASRNLTRAEAAFECLEQLVPHALAEHNMQLACSAGCSHCCYQQVLADQVEWAAIQNHLDNRPELFNRLREPLWRNLQAWQSYVEMNPDALANPDKTCLDWWNQPCMFLDTESGLCSVYEVRPLACRGYVSTVKCESTHTEKTAVVLNLPWFPWLAEYILNGADYELLPLQEWAARKLKDQL